MLGDWGLDATRLGLQVPLLLHADLLLGLGTALERLRHPVRRSGLEEILHHEHHPLAVSGLALNIAHLQIEEPIANQLQSLESCRQLLQRVPDVHQQLAGALDGMLLGHVVGGLLRAQDELADDGADHLGREELAEEEVSDELHVGAHAILPLPALELDVLRIHVLRALVRRRVGSRHQLLELVLANVQNRRLEGHGLSTARRRELREDRLQAEDEVGVGLAVVRLRQRFSEDGLDDDLELRGIVDRDGGDALDDCGHVLRAHLVQQALHAALDLIVLAQLAAWAEDHRGWLFGRLAAPIAVGTLAADRARQLSGAVAALAVGAVRGPGAARLRAHEDARRHRGDVLRRHRRGRRRYQTRRPGLQHRARHRRC
mmetsp:Transcript_18699/g.48020  ORF Transcript_18699/g.48020 Transcript_18699/m.48020 type:complete len:373 (-) Transcript_18699:133-1251(-)